MRSTNAVKGKGSDGVREICRISCRIEVNKAVEAWNTREYIGGRTKGRTKAGIGNQFFNENCH